jgi:CheY-like chemotaxis protein
MKRRILLVDDDLAVLLTLKAVLELHGFEVETAASSAEAFARMDSGVYQMVISDLRMETEDAGFEVIRRAHRQRYDPATALLTAYPVDHWEKSRRPRNCRRTGQRTLDRGEVGARENPDSLLIKPLGTGDLLRQVEALLVHATRQATPPAQFQPLKRRNHRRAGMTSIRPLGRPKAIRGARPKKIKEDKKIRRSAGNHPQATCRPADGSTRGTAPVALASDGTAPWFLSRTANSSSGSPSRV